MFRCAVGDLFCIYADSFAGIQTRNDNAVLATVEKSKREALVTAGVFEWIEADKSYFSYRVGRDTLECGKTRLKPADALFQVHLAAQDFSERLDARHRLLSEDRMPFAAKINMKEREDNEPQSKRCSGDGVRIGDGESDIHDDNDFRDPAQRGGGEIRTRERIAPLLVFETSAFDRTRPPHRVVQGEPPQAMLKYSINRSIFCAPWQQKIVRCRTFCED